MSERQRSAVRDAGLTRRERVRQTTIEEIKVLARAQVIADGIGGLSLRAIAREMGLQPSGIYRYFANRDQLITALRATAYDDAADALADALARTYGADGTGPTTESHVARWLAVLDAYRAWGLGNLTDFGLVFGVPAAPLDAADDPTLQAAQRFAVELFTPYTEMLADGTIDLRRATMHASAVLEDRFSSFVSSSGPLSAEAVAVAIGVWSALHGWVSLEVFGHLGGLVSDSSRLFQQHALALLRAAGCDPSLLP